jgi:hypothetical protein
MPTLDKSASQKAVRNRLQQFVDANADPDHSENFNNIHTDDMQCMVSVLRHPAVATDPNYCLVCLTVRACDKALSPH